MQCCTVLIVVTLTNSQGFHPPGDKGLPNRRQHQSKVVAVVLVLVSRFGMTTQGVVLLLKGRRSDQGEGIKARFNLLGWGDASRVLLFLFQFLSALLLGLGTRLVLGMQLISNAVNVE